jgi:tetratricopeptide (TPR) repeat protein
MESISGQEEPQGRPVNSDSKIAVVGVCFLLAAAVFLVFGQTFRLEFVNYDDDEYVYENPQVTKGLTPIGIRRAFTHAHSANWHPLTFISHMLDCQFYGLKPGGHHLTNVLPHAATAIVIGTLMACASVQTSYWRNSESLWRHTLACTADNAIAENNLGHGLSEQGRIIESIKHCQKAVEITPNYAEAHYNLGTLLAKENRPVAIEYFQRAIEIRPDYAEAHYNLSVALYFDGRMAEAMEHCEQAIQLKPNYADACGQRANALVAQGRYAEAAEDFRRALQINPHQNEIHNNFGGLLILQGNITNAMEQYQQAIQIKPDYAEAHCNLAVAFALQNRLDDAVMHYRKAIQLKPDYAEAHENLANVLAAQGRLDEAIEHYQRAIELMPDDPQAHSRFGLALRSQKKSRKQLHNFGWSCG